MLRHTRLTESYDWMVLGDSPACLLSAALVARMGLSVLVVGDGSDKKWSLSSSGQVIDPETNFISGLGRPGPQLGLAGKCLEHFRLADSEWSLFGQEDPLFQALTPAVRAGFSSENELLNREVIRESGGSADFIHSLLNVMASGADSIRDYWSELPSRLTLPVSTISSTPSGLHDSGKKTESTPVERPGGITESLMYRELGRTWSELAVDFGRMSVSPIEREWIEAWLVASLGTEIPHRISGYELLQSLVLAKDGVRVRGGLSGLRQLLYRVAARAGAHVVDPTLAVSRLFMEEGKILGVQLSGAEDARNLTRARGILTSQHPEKVLSWMTAQEQAPSRYPETCEMLRITLALTVRASGIPVGMARRALWKEAGAPALELDQTDPADYGFLNSGSEFVFIRSYFPMEALSWPVHRWKTVCQRMFRQGCELMPFLEKNVERIFPDFRSENFEAEWSEYYGVNRLTAVDSFRAPVAIPSKPFLPQIEGLFYAHRSAAPASGWMGEWAAALNASAWIAHRSGIAGPLG